MIFIVAKFTVKPEWADRWLDHARPFTEATRAEPGNLFFDWSRSVDDPHTFVLVEGFVDGDAGREHVESDHFTTAQKTLPQALAATPQVISEQISATEWSLLGEMAVD